MNGQCITLQILFSRNVLWNNHIEAFAGLLSALDRATHLPVVGIQRFEELLLKIFTTKVIKQMQTSLAIKLFHENLKGNLCKVSIVLQDRRLGPLPFDQPLPAMYLPRTTKITRPLPADHARSGYYKSALPTSHLEAYIKTEIAKTNERERERCPICLESPSDFAKDTQEFLFIKCNCFALCHDVCLYNYLATMNKNCPVCRTSILNQSQTSG
jgi:hypothetical protein